MRLARVCVFIGLISCLTGRAQAPSNPAPTVPPTVAPTPALPAASPATPPAATPASVNPSGSHPLTADDLATFFDGILPLQMERSDIAGASVLVMKDGTVLLQKGYGYADVKTKKPVDPAATIFRLASISKLFTWVSVMQLVEQGKLDLDADVNRYLDFQIRPKFDRPVTLRNLMTHTGGFEEQLSEHLADANRVAGAQDGRTLRACLHRPRDPAPDDRDPAPPGA